MDLDTIAQRINEREFDCPFTLAADGTIGRAAGVYAPEVYHAEGEDDITIDGVPYRRSETWSPLTGMTGQYLYNGAVMHPSEFIGNRIAETMLTMCEDMPPQTFVIVAVEVEPEDDDEDPEPAGWAILHRRTA